MDKDDDILAALPRPPHPAPARREAAIAEALRRFDGGAAGRPASEARAPGPAPWRTWFARPPSGALAGALLVALIAVPLAWTSLPGPTPERGARPPAPIERAGDSGPVAADAIPQDPASAPAPSAKAADPEPAADVEAAADLPAAGPVQAAPPPPPAAEAEEPAAGRNEDARAAADSSGEIVVTGSRIARPNLASSSPVTVVNSEEVRLSRHRAPAGRGDWNACTIDDPGRSLTGCRGPAELTDGLARAWRGDWDGAARAFDSAIAAAPRSSAAYLNRGLLHRRNGDLDRALADLDRAVRFSPRAARFHYQRSLLLRQRGDVRRAEADEARAVALDPRYAAVVRGP